MQYYWLNKQKNEKLIIFFGGWSFDYKPFQSLDCNNYDVIMIYDFNNLDNLPDLENYKHNILISWSMGVFIAYLLKDKLPNFDKKIAVNGTPYPVDDEFGIPTRTFNLTLRYADSGLQGKFYENVFANDDFLKKYMKNPIERTIQNRVDELISLDKLIKHTNINYDNEFYDIGIVGNNDKIIPTKNQMNMWKEKAVVVEAGHFPFYNYTSWNEICK